MITRMWMGGEARRMSNSLCKRSLRGFVIGSLRSDCWPQNRDCHGHRRNLDATLPTRRQPHYKRYQMS
jgi:hypothetical protein